jgi:hypothetical protein
MIRKLTLTLTRQPRAHVAVVFRGGPTVERVQRGCRTVWTLNGAVVDEATARAATSRAQARADAHRSEYLARHGFADRP